MQPQLKRIKHALQPYYRPLWWPLWRTYCDIKRTLSFIFFPRYLQLPRSCVRIIVNSENDILLASYGGVMSVTMAQWLGQYKQLFNLSEAAGAAAACHFPYPAISTNRRLRLVYIFGDPIMSVLSVFRRHFQLFGHYAYVAGDYSQYTSLSTRIKMRSLKSYLASDIGAFPIQQHFHNWRTAPTQHPILFIRAETVWDNLDILQSFLELPDEAMRTFPKQQKRLSSYKRFGINRQEQDKLNQLYGDFKEELKQMPDTYIRPADWPVTESIKGPLSSPFSQSPVDDER